MKGSRFILVYVILVIAQILLRNYCNFTQYLAISFLPAMIMCLPLDKSTVSGMFIAFITGFIVDFLTDGQLGLTILALVPVALVRRWVILAVFGEEVFSSGENISFNRQGAEKIFLSIFMLTSIFMLVFIAADGAGTRPFWFNLVKFLISVLLSSAVSYFIAKLLCADYDSRWK